jgi:hypothetical protein
MRRTLVIASVLLAALAVAAPSAGAHRARHGFLFELHVDGFWIQGRGALGTDRIRLLLDRHGEVAYYYVGAKVGAGTVAARFGHLGAIDLSFSPAADEGPLGCGDYEGWQRGAFHGSIEFRGEHDYAHVDADRAKGWFQTRPRTDCAGDRRRRSAAAATASSAPSAETGVLLDGVSAPRAPSRVFYFHDYNSQTAVRYVFNAFLAEEREGMTIERGAQVLGGARTFEWDLGNGTARVEPPAPFSGRAFYRTGRGGVAEWTGSLRAPVLGGAPIRLTGPSFETHLRSRSY